MYTVIKKERDNMKVDIENLVSMTEANQNFSKVARLVDENGVAVILKNNTPRYVILDYSKIQEEKIADDDDVKNVSEKILSKHLKAFEELAK